jgi:hypothetical protein
MLKSLTTFALVASASGSTPGTFEAAVTGSGVIIASTKAVHSLQISYAKTAQVVATPIQIVTRDADGNVAAGPTLGQPYTDDFKVWRVDLSDLKTDHSYEAKILENRAFPCLTGVIAGVCQTFIKNPTIDHAGGNNNAEESYMFTYINSADPLEGVFKKASSISSSGEGLVRFELTWNRPVTPNSGGSNFLFTGIKAVDNGGTVLPLRDLTYGKTKWAFSVQGQNGNAIILSLKGNTEPVAFDNAGSPNTMTEEDFKTSISFVQDCVSKIVYKTKPGEFTNLCLTGDSCLGNEGKTFANGIVFPLDTVNTAQIGGLNGGKSCPPIPTTKVSPCTCSQSIGKCTAASGASLCGKMAEDDSCSCKDDCNLTNNCCSDVAITCPASLPICASPGQCEAGVTDCPAFSYPKGSVECQESARDSDGNPLCFCDQWCVDEGTCCQNYNENCYEGLCSKKAVGDFCNAEYVPGKFDGCQCDRDCLAIGDCCRDFTTVCGGEPLCGNSGNCNKMMGSSTGNWCMCDHQCLAPENNDCCSDYEAKCEVQATCLYRKLVNNQVKSGFVQPSRKAWFAPLSSDYIVENSALTPDWAQIRQSQPVNKYTWTPLAEHIPAYGCGSVRFTMNDAWCSCDDQCLFWGDCCPDYQSRCRNW